MRALAFYIVSYIIFPVYGVVAHPGLAVGLVAGLTVSAPFMLVGVVIFAIGFPVGVSFHATFCPGRADNFVR
jgi:hypothetical protein